MEVTGLRTRLLPGMAERYCRVHSQIPDAIADALRECGVVRWHIWRDGDVLFHTIETTDGLAAMEERMDAYGPIDPEWNALIDTLVDRSESATSILEPVWTMTRSGQFGGAEQTSRRGVQEDGR
jgi:L-rhamnose mutarotase